MVEIRAENSGLLIGRKGQTLEALQYLVSRISRRARRELRVLTSSLILKIIASVAANLWKIWRLRLGEKAKRQRKTVTVDALSAADRRIIHAALQDDPWVTTKSLGQGSYRRLLIIPEGDRRRRKRPQLLRKRNRELKSRSRWSKHAPRDRPLLTRYRRGAQFVDPAL